MAALIGPENFAVNCSVCADCTIEEFGDTDKGVPPPPHAVCTSNAQAKNRNVLKARWEGNFVSNLFPVGDFVISYLQCFAVHPASGATLILRELVKPGKITTVLDR